MTADRRGAAPRSDPESHSTLGDRGVEPLRRNERALAEEIEAGRSLIAAGEARIGQLYKQLLATQRRLREVQETARIDTSGLRRSIAAERRRTAAMRSELLAKGDEFAVIDRQRAEAAQALAVIEESVTWRVFQRLRAHVYPALGGRRAPAARALSACVRLAGKVALRRDRDDAPAVVEVVAAPAAQPRAQDPIVLQVFPDPRVSLVIPLYSGAATTRACLESIRDNTSGVSYEVILVDDHADRETKELLKAVRGARIVANKENIGYLRSVNAGARNARGRWLVLCNNDIQVSEGWLLSLVDCGESAADIAIVTPRYLYPDGRLNEAGGIIWNDGTGANYGRGGDPELPAYNYRREVDYGSAAALLVRADVFSELGGYDERFIPMYYEDADLCFSARRDGLRVMYEPEAVVIHAEGGTAGTDPLSGHKRYQERNRSVFVQKWGETLAARHFAPCNGAPRLAADRLAGTHVLVIDHQLPTPDRDAGSVRMLGMIQALQSLGNQVTFLPDNGAAPQPYTRALQELGVEVLGDQPTLHAQLIAGMPRFKAVLVSRPGVAPRWLAMVRELAPSATVIYDTVDLHWIRELRALALNGNGAVGSAKAAGLRELELAMVRATDATLVATEVERRTVLDEVPDARVHAMPMIHEVAPVVPSLSARAGIVFVGSFAHPPNADAVIHLVKDVMPAVWRRLPGVPVTIVGAGPPPAIQALSDRLVDVTGWVEEIDPLLHGARLLAAPLRFGAGMKGKVTQSLSLGLPVVTTPIGAEGIETGADAGVLVAVDPLELAELIVEVYTDDVLWRRMSRGGQASVARSYSPAVARRVFKLLLSPAEVSSTGSARPRALHES